MAFLNAYSDPLFWTKAPQPRKFSFKTSLLLVLPTLVLTSPKSPSNPFFPTASRVPCQNPLIKPPFQMAF